MAEPLTNSRRRFDKATYTPIRLAQEAAGGALAVAAAVQAASIAPGEIAELRQQLGDAPERRALEAIAALVEAPVGGPATRGERGPRRDRSANR